MSNESVQSHKETREMDVDDSDSETIGYRIDEGCRNCVLGASSDYMTIEYIRDAMEALEREEKTRAQKSVPKTFNLQPFENCAVGQMTSNAMGLNRNASSPGQPAEVVCSPKKSKRTKTSQRKKKSKPKKKGKKCGPRKLTSKRSIKKSKSKCKPKPKRRVC